MGCCCSKKNKEQGASASATSAVSSNHPVASSHPDDDPRQPLLVAASTNPFYTPPPPPTANSAANANANSAANAGSSTTTTLPIATSTKASNPFDAAATTTTASASSLSSSAPGSSSPPAVSSSLGKGKKTSTTSPVPSPAPSAATTATSATGKTGTTTTTTNPFDASTPLLAAEGNPTIKVDPATPEPSQLKAENLSLTETEKLLQSAQGKGSIELSISYLELTGKLLVRVLAARDLPAKDSGSPYDTYAKLYLEPFHDRSTRQKHKTAVVKHSLDPEFKETFEFSLPVAELPQKRLYVGIWDAEHFGVNHALCCTSLRLDNYGSVPDVAWHNLFILPKGHHHFLSRSNDNESDGASSKSSKSGKSSPSKASTERESPNTGNLKAKKSTNRRSMKPSRSGPKPQVVGELKVQLSYNDAKQVLLISVGQFRNTNEAILKDVKEVYLKLYLLPDPFKNTKTKSKTRELASVVSFDETFKFPLTVAGFEKKKVKISIWSHSSSKFGSNEEQAYTSILLSSIADTKSFDQWCALEQKGIRQKIMGALEGASATSDYSDVDSNFTDYESTGAVSDEELPENVKSDDETVLSLNEVGSIFLSLAYHSEETNLVAHVRHVKLHSKPHDKVFVKIAVLPDHYEDKQTSTKSSGKDIKFDEKYSFHLLPDSYKSKRVEFSVWSKGGSKSEPRNNFIGGSIFSCEYLQASKPISLELKLTPLSFGELRLTFSVIKNQSTLRVIVNEARNLPPVDADKSADPYVKMYFVPGKETTKKVTSVVRKTLNPTFEQTFDWELAEIGTNLTRISFFCLLMDQDENNRSDIIGLVTIPLAEIVTSPHLSSKWYTIGPASELNVSVGSASAAGSGHDAEKSPKE